jgi:hypothetical protein
MTRRGFIGAAIGAPCSRLEPACSTPRSVFEIEWHAHFFTQTTCRTPPAVMVTW